MRIVSLLPVALSVLLVLSPGMHADTVVLKSGEKIEGKLLNETDTELTVSVQVTPTIKDERVIKKADIDRIEKVEADEVAWAALAGVEPGGDSLEADDYRHVIAMLQNFLASHPESKHAAVVKQRVELFQEEQRRVDEGQLKMDGEWLGREKVEEERIQLAGRMLLNRMKRSAAAGRLTEAMSIFDLLEKNFGGSADYPNAVTLAKQILPSLKYGAEQAKAQLKRRADDNKVRLATAQGNERKQLEALLAKEKVSTEAAVAAVEKSGVRWFPLSPATDRSLTSLLSRISTESSRLDRLPLDKMIQSVEAAETAEAELRSQNLPAAEAAVNEASKLWPANELAKRLKEKVSMAKGGKAPAKPADKTAPSEKTPASRPKASHTAPPAAEAIAREAAPVQPPASVPFFKKPAFFVAASAVVAFGAIGVKAIAKRRAMEGNLSGR